jgi:hypothetical protein
VVCSVIFVVTNLISLMKSGREFLLSKKNNASETNQGQSTKAKTVPPCEPGASGNQTPPKPRTFALRNRCRRRLALPRELLSWDLASICWVGCDPSPRTRLHPSPRAKHRSSKSVAAGVLICPTSGSQTHTVPSAKDSILVPDSERERGGRRAQRRWSRR